MGEVLCTASWDAQKKQRYLQWLSVSDQRQLIVIGCETGILHPRIYVVDHNPLLFYQMALDFIYLPFTYEDVLNPAIAEFARIQENVFLTNSDFADQGQQLMANMHANLRSSFSLATTMHQQFTHTSAIVCGAGPSLDALIPFLQKAGSSFLIIGCGAGVTALLAAGIKPHIAVHIDMKSVHTFTQHDIPLFFELRTDPNQLLLTQKEKFLMGSGSSFLFTQWIENQLGLPLDTQGGLTSTLRGCLLAEELGCPAIYLAGMDFSYGSSAYAKGVKAKEIDPVEIVIENQKIITRADWLHAAHWLDQYVAQSRQTQWYILGKHNLLMPRIPLKPFPDIDGVEHSLEAISQKITRCFTVAKTDHLILELTTLASEVKALLNGVISRFQHLFPQMPGEDENMKALIQAVDDHPLVKMLLTPIWHAWEPVFKREKASHPDELLLHRILLFQSVMGSV